MSLSIDVSNQGPLPGPPKKRKLRHPRTSKACAFCRRRKVRCSGTDPCDYCATEEVRCDFEDDLVRPSKTVSTNAGQSPFPLHQDVPPKFVSSVGHHDSAQNSALNCSSTTPHQSRRNSIELPQAFAEGQLIGPTSGVSLLYHPDAVAKTADADIQSATLEDYGDFPGTKFSPSTDQELHVNNVPALIDRYFRFASPTYRFLHKPTIERWASQVTSNASNTGPTLAPAQNACVLLVCAQALLYSVRGNRYTNAVDLDLQCSRQCYEKAKLLLDREPGPATTPSVQARLGMCLYLLSTFRITACRFAFGFTHTVLTSMGLHRRSSSSRRLDLLEVESRRRTFWCAYVLDHYLSVMLGRPSLLRDNEIDQPYPRNFDDQDLMSSASAEDLPLHGNLEAFIGHIGLAKLMAKNTELLYPLKALSEEEVLTRTTEMTGAIKQWKESLPEFLKPREKTLTGQRTFERQNTVLKLAHSHLSILATRRCLLIDFSRLGKPVFSSDSRARDAIKVCMVQIANIINATYDLLERDGHYQAFWYTHYISLVAISTLYVLLIQDARASSGDRPLHSLAPEINLGDLYEKAKYCQAQLAPLSPEHSQSYRHHRLLDQLKARCEKDLSKGRKFITHVAGTEACRLSTSRIPSHKDRTALPATSLISIPASHARSFAPVPAVPNSRDTVTTQPQYPENQSIPVTWNETNYPVTSFTPTSEQEGMFSHFDSWGWEDLDVLGVPANGDFDYIHFTP